MTEHDRLLAGVFVEPDPDEPRLIYADWLDEYGDAERAEFIRVQCELARLPEDDDRRWQLRRRARQLLDRRGKDWLRPLLEAVSGVTASSWFEFRRGFVEFAWFHDDLPRLLPEVCSLAPLRAVGAGAGARDLHVLEAILPVLERWPYPHALLELVLSLDIRLQREVTALASFASLGRLTALNLGFYDGDWRDGGADGPVDEPFLVPEVAEALTRARVFDRVTDLSLAMPANTFGGAVAAFLAPRAFPSLRRLSLTGTLGDEGLAALAASPGLARLESLELHQVVYGGAGLEALWASPHLRGLKRLALPMGWLQSDARRALLAWPGLRELTALDVSNCHFDDAVALALAAMPPPARLRRLDLAGADLSVGAVETLVNSPALSELRELVLGPGEAADTLAPVLARATGLTQLRRLGWHGGGDRAKQALRDTFGECLEEY